jgi:hypothetical protein
VGFNMSWIFVDHIDLNELYAALDVKSTGEAADPYDLGTGRVPLAGLKPKEGWCAIFGHYSFVLDITIGTDPPRLMHLPAKSRAVSCVVLEHANISYASLWQDGRQIWEVRDQPSKDEPNHLVFWGDLPTSFVGIWGAALEKRRISEAEAKSKPNDCWGPTDNVFSVPLDTAASITEFRHNRGGQEVDYRDVTTLEPINGNALRRLSNPPGWWQTVHSTKYYAEGEVPEKPSAEFMKEVIEALKRGARRGC